jgi:hypothetical protein
MSDFSAALARNARKYGLAGLGLLCAFALFRFLWWLLDQALGDVFLTYVNSHGPDWLKWFAANPLSSVVGAGILFVAFCALAATRDEWIRKYVEFMREPDEPALDILWEPGKPIYYHSYPLPPDMVMNLQFRICVLNISKRAQITDIEVTLENLEPRELPCVPCHLRLMNDIPTGGRQPTEKFSLNRDGKQFIDLMVQKPNAPNFWIWHTVLPIDVTVPAQRYTFTIAVTSKDAPRVARDFVIEKDGPMWGMRMLPKGVQRD